MLDRLHRDAGYQRGVELGPYPLEMLTSGEEFAPSAPFQTEVRASRPSELARAAELYTELFLASATQPSAKPGQGSKDPWVRAREVKAAAYYLDAAHVGICQIPRCALLGRKTEKPFAAVILVEYGCDIEPDNLAHTWLQGCEHVIAHMRAVEIGVSILGHIRALGFNASIAIEGNDEYCLNTLALQAGLVQRRETGVESPFIGNRFATVAIITDYAMACDLPLAPTAKVSKARFWLGINGATSGRELRRRARRASHLSRYPMEKVRRKDNPTTRIYAEEVPRVPKRAEFFMRARMGDLGQKAQEEVRRFAFKHPLTDGMMYPLRSMVPHQEGAAVEVHDPTLEDAEANAQAIRSLSYHLGADLTGICEIPPYAWYSHGPDGEPIEMRHKYAVVMLIDQGYDTMEGASGDDWISGCQSMRGYIRGAEIAGIMADFLRKRGVEARAQTNADSQVLHIPLILLAGLGELSRIGELVLNPFVGPRFKSVVLTTNLPLIADKPIDFGLQDFCSQCLKCARECPVNAIPFGDKVVFNGYEIWKPDVERCTRYRVTNPRGSACGRCMKTCPLNKALTSDGAWLNRAGNWLGIHAHSLKKWLAPLAIVLDDKLGHGKRNPCKKWWQDLEIIDGVATTPKATNEREIDPDADVSGRKSPVGYYSAADNPAPNATEPVLANHKAAIARATSIESVCGAETRRRESRPVPAHYTPTPLLPLRDITDE